MERGAPMTTIDQHKSIEQSDRRIEVCRYATEWAEHARFYLDNEPCDDGRQAISCGNREKESPCPA